MVSAREAICGSALFRGIYPQDIDRVLYALNAVKRTYAKDDFVFVATDKVSSVGIVLSGRVQVVQEDYWGNRSILAFKEPGDMFGEAIALGDLNVVPVSVIATEHTEVLFIEAARLMRETSQTKRFRPVLVENLVHILANNNIMLSGKVSHVTKRTTREKLLSYLSSVAQAKGSNVFDIPFNRRELAQYLAVDRSAMSTELSKLQTDGFLEYDRNHFILYMRGYPHF